MNCGKFFGLLLIGNLSAVPISALELQQLWEVTLPEGQTYMRANIAWSPSDSLPHLFMMGREDLTVYHMTPGQEFEPVLTLPDYPLGGIKLFGVCLDTTWESSVLVHYRDVGADSGCVDFVNLLTGDSLVSISIVIHYEFSCPTDELEFWRQPGQLFCNGAGNGMIALLYSTHRENGYHCDILGNCERWSVNDGHSVGWSAKDFHILNAGTMPRINSHAFCLIGNDSFPDWAVSGRTWGWSESEDYGHVEFDWKVSYIAYLYEGWNPLYISTESTGEFLALERADGPAWGLLFFCNDSMTYYQRGPIHVWTVPSSIPGPTLATAFPRRLLPQRVALIYSSAGRLTEVDLLDGHITTTADFPRNVRMLQPYLAEDGAWELMAVFDRSACGYRVTGLLPVDDEVNAVMPHTFSLSAFPNPFNETVKIVYELPQTAAVQLRLVDILGREAALLVNDREIAGKHEATWNAKDVASGIYFVCLNSESATRVHKLVHLK